MMIKFSKLLTFITTIILFVGCFNEHYWQFNKALSDVAHISIIYLETHKLTEDIISTPSEKEVNLIYFDEFYNEVENMKMKSRFAMKLESPSGYCFLIDYGNNEDYCVISQIGSGNIFKSERGDFLEYESTDYIFDKEEFSSLINKYLEK